MITEKCVFWGYLEDGSSLITKCHKDDGVWYSEDGDKMEDIIQDVEKFGIFNKTKVEAA